MSQITTDPGSCKQEEKIPEDVKTDPGSKPTRARWNGSLH